MMVRPGGQSRPHFHVFGIPVTIDPWMLIGLVLLYSVAGGGRSGAFAAGFIAVFTLIHEIGHALVARRFGAVVAIRLAFLGGWASYGGGRPLSRWQRNVVSLAGPLTQLVVGLGVIAAVRASFPDVYQMTDDQQLLYYDLHWALGFAGPVIAMVNLLPFWPLDGGHIAWSAFERLGAGAHRTFMWWSLGGAGVMAVMSAAFGSDPTTGPRVYAQRQLSLAMVDSFPAATWRMIVAGLAFGVSSLWIAIFVALGAAAGLQVNRARREWIGGADTAPKQARSVSLSDAVRAAERQGWDTGAPGPFPRGFGPSPWLEAELARRRGGSPEEVSGRLAHLSRPSAKWEVDRLDRREIGELLTMVPPQSASSANVLRARVHHGSLEDLIAVAMVVHRHDDSAEPFYLVGEGAAARGDLDEAMNWLTSAVERSPDPTRLRTSRLLRPLHGRSDFQQLIGTAERATR